jgi:hypothetical protein
MGELTCNVAVGRDPVRRPGSQCLRRHELPERGRRLMEPSASGSSNRPERGLLVEEGLPGVLFGVLH